MIFGYLSIPNININYDSDKVKIQNQEGFYQVTFTKLNKTFKIPYSVVKTGIDINGGIVLQYDADVSGLDDSQKVEALKNVKKN